MRTTEIERNKVTGEKYLLLFSENCANNGNAHKTFMSHVPSPVAAIQLFYINENEFGSNVCPIKIAHFV